MVTTLGSKALEFPLFSLPGPTTPKLGSKK